MARKRKFSDMDLDAVCGRVRTTPKQGDLFAALDYVCQTASINLPHGKPRSPSVQNSLLAQKIVTQYSLVFFKQPDTLHRIHIDFFNFLPAFPSEEERLKVLDALLKEPAEKIRDALTPAKDQRHRDFSKNEQADDDVAPPSPTFQKSQRIDQAFRVAKSGMSFEVKARDKSTVQKSTMPTSADTSFSSTVMNSAWSQQELQGSMETPETSFETPFNALPSPPNARISDELSSLSTTEAEHLLAMTQQSEAASFARDSTRFSKSDCGSPIGPSDISVYPTLSALLKPALHPEAEAAVIAWDVSRERPTREDLMKFEPSNRFAQFRIPKSFAKLPFAVQWEAQRLLHSGKVVLEEIERAHLHDLEGLYDLADSLGITFRSASAFWAGDANSKKCTLPAKLEWAVTSQGAVFDFVPEAPQEDTGCDLQRRFGAENVLMVNQPSLNTAPNSQKYRQAKSPDEFCRMASTPQEFFGRTWVLIDVQSNKGKKSASVDQRSGTHRLIFLNITQIPLGKVMEYILPYEENKHQTSSKLYSRIDLSLSRTHKTIQFDSADIEYNVKDQFATQHRGNTEFLDPALRHLHRDELKANVVMSDGCHRMSYWTACKITQQLGGSEVRPAYQCRIAGAKGVWFIENDYDYNDLNEKPSGFHIHLAESQLKVHRQSLRSCDSQVRALNVIKSNTHARASILYTGYLPILLDRGVSREAIFDVVDTQVRAEANELLEALDGPVKFRTWLHSKNGMLEELSREASSNLDALRSARGHENIVKLLESGFDHRKDTYLAHEVSDLLGHLLNLERKRFKIRLSKSTTLWGIADPKEVLEPHEIHVNFSSAFHDRVTKQSWWMLDGMDGLIARNPAMAAWDIQRVKFVFKPELRHLKDLIVFPTKGRSPLAGLLQGGDYDGDTFWICWEPKLVSNFMNAPGPINVPTPRDLGIVKKTETLEDYVKDPSSDEEWHGWLGKMGAARLDMNLLGSVTNIHECVTYKSSNIRAPAAEVLVHLHDYLVDADKQGYVFTREALNRLLKKHNISRSLPEPWYWSITKAKQDDPNDATNPVSTAMPGENIIDQVFTKKVQPILDGALKKAKSMLSTDRNSSSSDEDLTAFYNKTVKSIEKNHVAHNELKILKERFQDLRNVYRTHVRDNTLSYEDVIAKVRQKYDEIVPRYSSSNPTIVEWTRCQGNSLTLWEKLKASAFAHFQHRAYEYPGRFVFNVARDELCELKAAEVGDSRLLVLPQYKLLKVRKPTKTFTAGLFDEDGAVGDRDDYGDGDVDEQDEVGGYY